MCPCDRVGLVHHGGDEHRIVNVRKSKDDSCELLAGVEHLHLQGFMV
jgi:hypothetical protein